MASMLGMSRQECMGFLCDYWAWLDANTRHDFVPNLSRQCLDDVLHCAGFAAALEAVGWAEWASNEWGMRVINYDHHNGSSAKTRASDQRKKREQRRDKNGTETGLEVEKRRVIKRERLDAPTDEHREIAKRLQIDCDLEWAKYLDHQVNAKNKHGNLEAGFRNWLKRAEEFRPQRGGKTTNLHDKRAATAAAFRIGSVSNEPSDITAESERVA